ncbi:MAG: hypothetical protein V9G14_12965 [Cypionkella sp.]
MLDRLPELPEMQEIHDPDVTVMPRHPESTGVQKMPGFWAENGRTIARRNLWLSIPALLLAFSVWMVWSMVDRKTAGHRLCLHA